MTVRVLAFAIRRATPPSAEPAASDPLEAIDEEVQDRERAEELKEMADRVLDDLDFERR